MQLTVCVPHTLLSSVHLLFHHLICSWFRIAYLRAEKILCHPESNERNGAFLVICPCFSDTDLQFNLLVIEDGCWGYLSVHPSSLIFKSDFLLSQDVLDQKKKKYSYGTELCPLHCECTSVCVYLRCFAVSFDVCCLFYGTVTVCCNLALPHAKFKLFLWWKSERMPFFYQYDCDWSFSSMFTVMCHDILRPGSDFMSRSKDCLFRARSVLVM